MWKIMICLLVIETVYGWQYDFASNNKIFLFHEQKTNLYIVENINEFIEQQKYIAKRILIIE